MLSGHRTKILRKHSPTRAMRTRIAALTVAAGLTAICLPYLQAGRILLRRQPHEIGAASFPDTDLGPLRSSPSGGYAPANVTCSDPQAVIAAALANFTASGNATSSSNTTSNGNATSNGEGNGTQIGGKTLNATYVGQLRNASDGSLSPLEAIYIERHLNATQQAWVDWLTSAPVGLNASFPQGLAQYLGNGTARLPRVGIAASGGGFRATLFGAGAYNALDQRNTTSAQQTGVAGFYQLASYITGLSGGSWLVSSTAINDYPTAQALYENVWNLSVPLLVPPDAVTVYNQVTGQVAQKAAALGTNFTTLTDYWGRILSQVSRSGGSGAGCAQLGWMNAESSVFAPLQRLFNTTAYPQPLAPAVTWSDVTNVSAFANASYPFPIIIAATLPPGAVTPSGPNGSDFEFSPYESGIWSPGLQAFINTSALGSVLQNGQPGNSCLAGLDNVGFIAGTSSSLFNEILTLNASQSALSNLTEPIQNALSGRNASFQGSAVIPNPYLQYGDDPLAQTEDLLLVDGGLTDRNIPLWPLLQPARNLSVVLALDASNDVNGWPNGTSLFTTAELVRSTPNVSFPVIPPQAQFIAEGLNTRPTFFGCPGAEIINANTSTEPSPIIIYVPNYPYESFSNFSTFKLQYNDSEAQSLIDNSYLVASAGGNRTLNTTIAWPTCLACASMVKIWNATNSSLPEPCTACFNAYCWLNATSADNANGTATTQGAVPSSTPTPPPPATRRTFGLSAMVDLWKRAPDHLGDSVSGSDHAHATDGPLSGLNATTDDEGIVGPLLGQNDHGNRSSGGGVPGGYSPPIGYPEFILSNGTVRTAPPVTYQPPSTGAEPPPPADAGPGPGPGPGPDPSASTSVEPASTASTSMSARAV